MGFIYRSWMKNQGFPEDLFDGRPPEPVIGGNLALVQNGDMIELDVAKRRIHLEVTEEALIKRKQAWQRPEPITERCYVNLYINHIQQADKGADLDFLSGKSGSEVSRDSH
jgi:L-arabonate dehydrase